MTIGEFNRLEQYCDMIKQPTNEKFINTVNFNIYIGAVKLLELNGITKEEFERIISDIKKRLKVC